ncbi:UDP-glycosyltransferase 89B2-like [Pistacia vera]|uniref:UDP-glycosyltransferase 89B2-like n=1 Tax=Pistacia vera TaxID=55513 RepID=UPI0012639B4A|nr:UDP-glycosyltransferase 89B2-like [Pistacia vera]
MSPSKPHILVYPYPASGHIIPLLDLTHRLLSRGLNVTVLLTPNTVSLLDPLLSSRYSSSLQSLIFPSPESPTRPGFVFNMMSLRDLHYPLLLQWFRSHPSPPVAIISDFFLGWTHQLASEVGVARVVFSCTGAFGLSIFFTLWRDQPKRDDPHNDNSLVHFPNLPNCPHLPWYQVPTLYRTSKPGEPVWEFVKDVALGDIASWGIVFNTSAHLEQVYIEHIKTQVGHDRLWAVGPLLPKGDDLAGGTTTNRGGSSSVACHEVMTWLDARKDESVVYICFGSHAMLSRKQMEELATAVEKSQVNFIWGVKQPNERHVAGDYGIIPKGYEDRVAGRGYIIKGWAPQVEILRHRAVGVFLTHCGWNSTLEGVAAGVVMLTWPMGAEQFVNAKLLVEQLGVGIRVGEAIHNIPESTELARLLIESLDDRRPQRVKAKELRDAVLGGVAQGGSSDKYLDEFVRSLNELQSPKVLTKQS